MEIYHVKTAEQLEKALQIRNEVFVKEQGVPSEAEYDQHDSTNAKHILVMDQEIPVGTGRIRIVEDQVAKIERVCLLSSHRGHGLGKIIMLELENIAKELGAKKIKLHAQGHAEKFYKMLGYTSYPPTFIEEGIKHILMTKELTYE